MHTTKILHAVFLGLVSAHGLGIILPLLLRRKQHSHQNESGVSRVATFVVNVALVMVGVVAFLRNDRASRHAVDTTSILPMAGVVSGSIISLIARAIGPPRTLQAIYELFSCIIWTVLICSVPTVDITLAVIAVLYLAALITTLGAPLPVGILPRDDSQNPLSEAPLLTTCSLSWLDPLMKVAASSTLSHEDVWPVDEKLSVRQTLRKRSLQPDHAQESLHRGLHSILWRSFPHEMTWSACLALVNVVSTLGQPFLLQSLLKNADAASVAGLFTASLVVGVTEAHMKLVLRQVGVHLRSTLTAYICDRCMANHEASHSVSDPAVLVEIDLVKVFELVEQYHLLWMIPLQSAISIVALTWLLGWQSVLVGLLSPILCLPILSLITKSVSRTMIGVMQAKDSRVSLISEVMKQVKQIKLGALHHLFERRIDERRAAELEQYRAVAVLNAGMVFIVFILSPAMVSLMFGSSTFLGHPLTSHVIFPALALCSNVSRAASLLPRLIMMYQAGRISFGRIRDFLLVPAMEKEDASPVACDVSGGDAMLCMQGCDIGFDATSRPVLRDCSMSAHSTDLLVVSGPVGSGKTLLIRSLIGDISPSRGKVDIGGKIAYASQKPFLISATVRDNILFGLPFDGSFYEKVIEAVMPRYDLDRLPEGDSTMLGGAAVTLSGGQKSRIALARAVYSRRKVVVLDDPLAAVDAKVQSQLIQRLLGPRGILKDTLRIVSTSSASLIAQADKLYTIQEGTLMEAVQSPSIHPQIFEVPCTADTESPKLCDTKQGPVVLYGSVQAAKDANCLPDDLDGDPESAPLLTSPRTPGQMADTGDSPVKLDTYIRFLRLAKNGGWLFVLLTATASKVLDTLAVYFLKLCGERFEAVGYSNALAYYALCALVGGSLSAIFVLVAYFVCVIPSSRSIHAELTRGVLESRFSFFDTMSLGQILNRFTNDMNKIDYSVNGSIISLVAICVSAMSSVLVVIVALPWSITYLIPIGGVYLAIQTYYLHACRQLRRLETLSRGPILNLLGEIKTGAAVIRTFDQTETFKDRARDLVDNHIRVWAPFVSLDSWLVLRLTLLSSIIQLFTASSLLWLHASAGTLGLVINYLILIISQFNQLVQMRSTLEADITSAERVWLFASGPPENDECRTISVPAAWPRQPAIAFNSYSASYKTGQQHCLSHLNFFIQPGEHVAVVGRTGAGKSSLALAVMGVLEKDLFDGGSITIDGVDVSGVSLIDLRRRVTLLPQEPVVFEGTIRDNLNLDRVRTDEQLGEALNICQAHRVLSFESNQDPLDYLVSESGTNLSSGQVQVLALARAILSQNKIVIFDEATAAMDTSTSSIIHKVIKQRFRDRTVIAITHSIESALQHDKVLVLDSGRVAGFATPGDLLKNRGSIFSQLVAEAGGTNDS